MQILLLIHSYLRWLIVVVAVVAIVKFALGWLRGGAFKGMDRGLASGFSGLLDLQVTLGLIFMLWTGFAGVGFPMVRIEHATTMIIAPSTATPAPHTAPVPSRQWDALSTAIHLTG